ncbi:MAG: hypothetical protein HY744_06825 [Deltaproteobacteria bacterium]|nr:hypothetical protein [Deltaproteobacteria bacterium]
MHRWPWAVVAGTLGALALASCASDEVQFGGGPPASSGGAAAGTGGAAQGGGAGAGTGDGAECSGPEDCTGEDTTCRYRRCTGGTCGFEAALLGTPCGDAETEVCDGAGKCLTANGSACAPSAPEKCASGQCADGVCCDAPCGGACEACAKAAGAAKDGKCALLPQGAAGEPACLPYVCNGSIAICPKTCSGAQDCAAGFQCDQGSKSCVAKQKKPAGESCQVAGECASGYCPAQDGVCCASACDGPCQACVKAKTGQGAGTCAPVLAQTDPDDECALSNTCDGAGSCGGGYHLWSKRFGDGAEQVATAVAAGGGGEPVLAGHFFGSLDLGGGPLTSAGERDLFVGKLDPGGLHLWSSRFGDPGNQLTYAVAVDPWDAVVQAGYFFGNLDFGGGSLGNAGWRDVFVAKFDPSGKHLWSKRFGGSSSDFALAVAVDGGGNVLLAGYYWSGGIDFGGGTLWNAEQGKSDVFLAKLDRNGQHLWSKRFGSAGTQEAWAVATDGAGNVVLVGDFYGSIDFGGGPLTSVDGRDIFVAKLDPGGQHLWSKRFGGSGDQGASAVALDAKGSAALVGEFEGSLDFGGSLLGSAGGRDGYVAKLDAAGDHVFSLRFGDKADQYGNAVAVDAAGAVAVAGAFAGAVDLGGGALASAGDLDCYVAKLDPNGQHLWSRRYGDAAGQVCTAVTADGKGALFVAGAFGGSIDFGGGALFSAGGLDGFVAKLAP